MLRDKGAFSRPSRGKLIDSKQIVLPDINEGINFAQRVHKVLVRDRTIEFLLDPARSTDSSKSQDHRGTANTSTADAPIDPMMIPALIGLRSARLTIIMLRIPKKPPRAEMTRSAWLIGLNSIPSNFVQNFILSPQEMRARSAHSVTAFQGCSINFRERIDENDVVE